jgi:hypothetical protein
VPANATLIVPVTAPGPTRSPDTSVACGALKSFNVITARVIVKSTRSAPPGLGNEQAASAANPPMSKLPGVTVWSPKRPPLRST